MTNLDLWGRLEKTDPSYTKQFTRGGGFRGTAINGTYIVRRLTEAFGPCGRGWRFIIEDERIEEGHTLKCGDKARVHIILGHIAYMVEGAWYETSPQFGQTMLVDENKNGPFTDEEAPKKSITDCIAKCAVMLGIGADVHLGLFDDNKYVNERRAEEAQKNGAGAGTAQVGANGVKTASPKAPPPAAPAPWQAKLDEIRKRFIEAPNRPALEALAADFKADIAAMPDQAQVSAREAYSARRADLTEAAA